MKTWQEKVQKGGVFFHARSIYQNQNNFRNYGKRQPVLCWEKENEILNNNSWRCFFLCKKRKKEREKKSFFLGCSKKNSFDLLVLMSKEKVILLFGIWKFWLAEWRFWLFDGISFFHWRFLVLVTKVRFHNDFLSIWEPTFWLQMAKWLRPSFGRKKPKKMGKEKKIAEDLFLLIPGLLDMNWTQSLPKMLLASR